MTDTTAVATREPAKRSVLMTIASRYGMEPAAFEATVRGACGLAGATREEFAAFLMVANEYKLNPATREIFAFPKKGGGIQPIVSIDGWLNLANSHPQFDGIEITFEHDDSGKLVSATAKVHRKDRTHPVVVTEYLAECVRSTDPWKMQHRMLRHKAAIQAIRYAFGFSGIMEPDEAEGISAPPTFTPEPRAVQELPRSPRPSGRSRFRPGGRRSSRAGSRPTRSCPWPARGGRCHWGRSIRSLTSSP